MEVIEGVCTGCGQRLEDVGQFHPIECCVSFKAGMKEVVEFAETRVLNIKGMAFQKNAFTNWQAFKKSKGIEDWEQGSEETNE